MTFEMWWKKETHPRKESGAFPIDVSLAKENALEAFLAGQAEMRELMPCGHPKACLVTSELPDFVGGRVEEQEVATVYCGCCEREGRKVEKEREACAKIAELHTSPYQDWGGYCSTETALAIAKAIRARDRGKEND